MRVNLGLQSVNFPLEVSGRLQTNASVLLLIGQQADEQMPFDAPVDLVEHRAQAYITPRDAVPSANDLREHLCSVLPAYMLPQHVLPLMAVPLLPNGKIDRRSLPAPTVQGIEPAPAAQQCAAPAKPVWRPCGKRCWASTACR